MSWHWTSSWQRRASCMTSETSILLRKYCSPRTRLAADLCDSFVQRLSWLRLSFNRFSLHRLYWLFSCHCSSGFKQSESCPPSDSDRNWLKYQWYVIFGNDCSKIIRTMDKGCIIVNPVYHQSSPSSNVVDSHVRYLLWSSCLNLGWLNNEL